MRLFYIPICASIVCIFLYYSFVSNNNYNRNILFFKDYKILSGYANINIKKPDYVGTAIYFDKDYEAGGGSYIQVINNNNIISLYYRCTDKKNISRVCLALSKDGIKFYKPNLGIIAYQESYNNNIISDYFSDGLWVFIVDNVSYLLGSYYDVNSKNYKIGIQKIDLKLKSFEIVNYDLSNFTNDSQNQIIYNSVTGKWTVFVRSWNVFNDLKGDDIQYRTVSTFTVQNPLTSWTIYPKNKPLFNNYWPRNFKPVLSDEANIILAPTLSDKPNFHIYTPGVVYIDNFFMAMPSIYYHNSDPPIGKSTNTGNVHIGLAYSVDGEKWTRFSEEFLSPNDFSGDVKQMYISPTLINVDGVNYNYVQVSENIHNTPSRLARVEIFKYKHNYAYASLSNAGLNAETEIITNYLKFNKELFLTYDCKDDGYIKVEIQNTFGRCIPGYCYDDFLSICSSGENQKLHFKNEFNFNLDEKKVRLKIKFKNATLYSLNTSSNIN